MQSLPAIELAVPQFAVESRPDEAALAGDGALAALAGMWATIFQQQVLPVEPPVEGEAWTGTSEPVQESAAPILAPTVTPAAGLMGRVQHDVPFIWSAIQLPKTEAGIEALPVADVRKLPGAEVLPVGLAGLVAPRPEGVEVPVATPMPVELGRGTDFESVPLPAESVVEPPPMDVPEGAALPERAPVVSTVFAVPNVPVATPVVLPEVKAQTGERSDPVEAAVAEQAPIPATNFETVVSLRKKLTDRLMPRVFDAERDVAAPVAAVPEVVAVPKLEATEPEAQPAPPAEIRQDGESLPEAEALPVQIVRPEVQEPADEARTVVAPRDLDQPKAAFEATRELPVAPVTTVDTRESAEVSVVPPTPSPALTLAAHPPIATQPTPPPRPAAAVRPPDPPAPPPAPAPGVPKTISIRIPLTEADRGVGSAARHIDLVFHQRNQDLTLQFHSPSSDVQRSLEASMPSLLDKLKTEDWTARPQEAAQAPMPAEAVLESRRRGDALMPVAVQLESGREAAPVAHSSSQNFGFDDSPADRNDSQQQQQQNGRNRKKEQAFQAEFDEQQEL